MELNEYQKQAMTTCMQSSNNFSYMMTNLVGEVGEFSSKVAKGIRKGIFHINGNELFVDDDTPEARDFAMELLLELGDVLWQTAGLCHVMKVGLGTIAELNLAKLASRKERGVIDGNGDNR